MGSLTRPASTRKSNAPIVLGVAHSLAGSGSRASAPRGTRRRGSGRWPGTSAVRGSRPAAGAAVWRTKQEASRGLRVDDARSFF